jgi:hypothetical protein
MIEPGSEDPPSGASVPSSIGTPIDFSFALLQPAGGPAASIQWSVDNTPVGGATATTFHYTPTAGSHTVSVKVNDTTTAVQAAMAGTFLQHVRAWSVVQSAIGAPSGLVAAAGSSSVAVSWGATSGATSYELWRRANSGAYALLVTTGGTSFPDSTVSAGNAYIYKVRAFVGGTAGPFSNVDLASVFAATDDPLTTGTRIKVAHLSEVRQAANVARAAAGLAAATYSRVIAAGQTVLASDLTETRAAIDAARSALGLAAFAFTDPTIAAHSTVVKRAHVAELRDALR